MDAVPGYLQKLAESVFKKHIVRVSLTDMKPPLPPRGMRRMAQYAYSVTYVEDPQADSLPINYETALSRHVTLRRNFS